MFNSIILVQKIGEGEKAMEIAEKYGATGGTILRGRGAAIHKENILSFFDLEIEPEKDILLIISSDETTDRIIEGLTKELQLEKENTGILFSFALSEVRGIDKSHSTS
ncbi:hypothetical protein GCM10008932_04730 [Alkalibacterium iburiense]|uniref:Nitrogen regulatory protein P-II n=1 Tax=Alkalibacterium iburiense TaxID=290589 RepID=A0ABN0X4E5_9LACT